MISELQLYIIKLEKTAKGLQSRVNRNVMSTQGRVMSSVKQRFFNQGLDGNLDSLGTYSEGYRLWKKSKGLRSTPVTLRLSGDWYKALFMRIENNYVLLDNKDWKTSKLVEKYGDDILELSEIDEVIIENQLSKLEARLRKDLDINVKLFK